VPKRTSERIKTGTDQLPTRDYNTMKLQRKTALTSPNSHRLLRVLAAVSGMSGVLTPVAFANVVGSDMQNFNATTSGLDFVTVESAETLQPGFINFGLFMNYAVNTLPYFEATDKIQSRTKFNDTLLGADLNVGYGVAKNLDLGLSLPQVVTSSVKANSWNGKFRDNGNTEIRANAKYRLLGDSEDGLAIQGVVNFNRTKDNPYVGKTSTPIYSVVLIGSKQLTSELGFGVNLGYRWRKAGEALPNSEPIKPLPNQVIWSTAFNYRLDSIDSKLIAEVFGSSPIKKVSTNSDRTASSSEALFGIKHDIDTNLAIHGGIGTEIARGLSSPDWRIYAGINYAIGPKFDHPSRATTQDPPVTAPVENPFNTAPKSFEKIVVHDVMFEFDSDHLVRGESKQMLKYLAEHLNQANGFSKLVVIGHTDSLGSEEYNDALSKRRAETIKKWLVEEQKVDANKISTEGHGEREPIAGNGNYQGRQLNRRVEFRIYRADAKEEVRSQINAKDAEGAKDPGEKPAIKAPGKAPIKAPGKTSKAKTGPAAKAAKPEKPTKK